MDTFNIICGVATLISFAFGIYVYIKSYLSRANEIANMAVKLEQLRYLHTGLGSIFTALDAIAHEPSSPPTPAQNLQTTAKIARDQAYALMRSISEFETKLEQWQYGKIIPSSKSSMPTPPV